MISILISNNVHYYNLKCDLFKWNLVCSGAERSELAKTMIMLGQAVGAVIFSPIADRFGRKTGSVISRILYFLTALATVFTPNIEVFLIFRFLQGTFQGVRIVKT